MNVFIKVMAFIILTASAALYCGVCYEYLVRPLIEQKEHIEKQLKKANSALDHDANGSHPLSSSERTELIEKIKQLEDSLDAMNSMIKHHSTIP